MNWNNRLTEILKIKFPIVQAPMLGVCSPEMVAAISNQGGLGSLPVGGLSAERTLELIQDTKALTSNPFAVNLFANIVPSVNIPIAEQMQDYLEKFALENEISFEKHAPEQLQFHSYENQIEILIAENVRIVSFTFGIPDDASIKKLKDNGVILIGTATCVREAQILEEKGIDIVTAQGIEAGGHRGTFLETERLPQIGSMSLIPQIADNVDIPVLAAGGINDGRTIKAALILGASGVQIGSAFIASDESIAMEAYKEAILNSTDTDSAITRSFSGRWARGIKNKFLIAIEESGLTIPQYPIQGGLASSIRQAATKQNRKDFIPLWAGQSASKAEAKSAAEIFNTLVIQTENL